MQNNYATFIKRRLIWLAVLLTLLVTMLCFSTNTVVCEWFSNNYSRWYVYAANFLFGWIPFSMYEVSLVIAIVAVVVCIVVIFKRLFTRRFLSAVSLLLALVLFGVAVGTVYVSSATMLYNREELPIELYSAEDSGALDYDTTMQMAMWYVEQLNAYALLVDRDDDGNVVLPSLSTMGEDINQLYIDSNNLDGYLSSVYVEPQYDTFGWVLSQMSITGIFFAPYAEININSLIDYATVPVTVAHEMAHSKGVMSETDANTVARYLLINSDVAYLKYAALLQCVTFTLQLVDLVQKDSTDYTSILDSISDVCYNDLSQISSFWSEYTLLDDVGSAINNIYLKLSGVEEGTSSYNPDAQLEDSGTVDDNGDTVWTVVEYSPSQRIIIDLYINSL